MTGRKILYILRHAKAETGHATQEDYERGLTDVGVQGCALMGRYMAAQGANPQLTLCSTATRARMTWDLVKKSAKFVPQETFTDRLYLASANETLNLLAGVSEDFERVMLVGHNPGLHQLCLTLAKRGEEALIDRAMLKFPTCALAVIELGDISWREAALASTTLAGFMTPRILSEAQA